MPNIDNQGRLLPTNTHKQVPATRKGKFETYNSDGTRERYFRDDDANLEELVARERMQAEVFDNCTFRDRRQNYDTSFAKNVMKKANWKVKFQFFDDNQ